MGSESSLNNMDLTRSGSSMNFRLKKLSILNNAHHKLRNIHGQIRGLAPRQTKISNVVSEVIYKEFMHGETVERIILYFPMVYGCEYRHSSAGCLNCGMQQGVFVRPYPTLLLGAFERWFKKWLVDMKLKGCNTKWFCVYIEGSWLNDKEVPRIAQRTILELLATDANAQRITIESRPEYITEEKVAMLDEISTNYGVELEVGIGVETSNDFIRKYCINKGFSFEDFTEKVKLLQTGKKLRRLAYKLFKPLFLSEYEAVLDTIESLNAFSKVGVDVVSIEIMSIQEWTLLEYLWLRDDYKLPWLWSVLYAMDKVRGLDIEIRLGGEPDTYFPASITTARNCKRCTRRIWERIRRYNETHNTQVLESYCDCKETWKEIIESEKEIDKERTLEERIAERIIKIAREASIQEYRDLKVLHDSEILYNSLGGETNGI